MESLASPEPAASAEMERAGPRVWEASPPGPEWSAAPVVESPWVQPVQPEPSGSVRLPSAGAPAQPHHVRAPPC